MPDFLKSKASCSISIGNKLSPSIYLNIFYFVPKTCKDSLRLTLYMSSIAHQPRVPQTPALVLKQR